MFLSFTKVRIKSQEICSLDETLHRKERIDHTETVNMNDYDHHKRC